jgi:hypothetical protein
MSIDAHSMAISTEAVREDRSYLCLLHAARVSPEGRINLASLVVRTHAYLVESWYFALRDATLNEDVAGVLPYLFIPSPIIRREWGHKVSFHSVRTRLAGDFAV